MERAGFDARMRWSRWTGAGLGGLLCLSLLLNLGQLLARPEPVTVLLPAVVSGGYELRASRFDARHLADSAVEASHLFFNVTPETLAHRRGALMAWTHPSAREAVAGRIAEETENIRRQALSLGFAVRDVATGAVGAERAEVVVTGVLTRWVADRRLDSVMTAVTVTFMRDARGAPLLAGIAWEAAE